MVLLPPALSLLANKLTSEPLNLDGMPPCYRPRSLRAPPLQASLNPGPRRPTTPSFLPRRTWPGLNIGP
ncbi:hypothetical protein BC629DRAFT_663414 [Irpex lacteus]|nr:hypothetical protein BC629DRAFT_663414 [Irpex lacteus]